MKHIRSYLAVAFAVAFLAGGFFPNGAGASNAAVATAGTQVRLCLHAEPGGIAEGTVHATISGYFVDVQ